MRLRQRVLELEEELAAWRRSAPPPSQNLTPAPALSQSMHLFQAALTAVPEAVSVKDRQGTYLVINPAGAQLLGKTVAEVLGKTDADLFPPAEVSLIRAGERDILETGTPVQEETSFAGAGGVKTYLNTKAPLFGAKQEVIGFFAYARDITALKETEAKLERSEKYYQTLIDQAMDLITVLNEDGTIRYVSPSVVRSVGYAEAELLGRNAFEYVHPEDLPLVLERFRQGIHTGVGSGTISEYRSQIKDGSWRHFETLARNLLTEPTVRGYVLNSRDVTERKQAEAALRESQAKSEALVSAIPDSIARLNREGLVLDYRPHDKYAIPLFDRDIIGRHSHEFLPEPYATLGRETVATALAQQKVQIIEYQVALNGKVREYESRVVPCGNGEVLALFRDITSRKETERLARESEGRYRLLFERIPYPAWVYDLETLRFLAANTAAVEHYGYSLSEFLGMTILDIRPPEEIPRLKENLAGNNVPPLKSRWKHLTKAGSLLEVEINSYDLEFQGRPARCVLVNDITEQLAYENRLVQKRLKLEEANLKLQEMNQIKSNFTAMLVHDLKSPLTVVKATIELFEGGWELPPEQTTQFIGASKRSLDKVLNLIGEMLEVFRTESSDIKLNCQPVDTNRFLEELVEEADVAARSKNIRVKAEIPHLLPKISVDAKQLERVFSNLLSNAIKFTPQDGAIMVEVDTKKGTGVESGLSLLLITITDTGEGIPASELPYVFEPYQQAHSKHTGMGVGLGLAIVKRLVAAHGGNISVRSQVGVGTSFSVLLPTLGETSLVELKGAVSKPFGTQNGLSPAPWLKEAQVLLVEDNPINQKVILRILQKLGISAACVLTGEEAVQKLEEHPFHLVLMDCQLPGMDGFETTREIRHREAQGRRFRLAAPQADSIFQPEAPIPVIALTASAATKAPLCFAAGMDDFLEKPVDIGKCQTVLEKWLSFLGDNRNAD